MTAFATAKAIGKTTEKDLTTMEKGHMLSKPAIKGFFFIAKPSKAVNITGIVCPHNCGWAMPARNFSA